MKLNVKRAALFFLGVLCAAMFITEWVIVLFKGSFTWFGLFVNLLELFVAYVVYTYFENYLEERK